MDLEFKVLVVTYISAIVETTYIPTYLQHVHRISIVVLQSGVLHTCINSLHLPYSHCLIVCCFYVTLRKKALTLLSFHLGIYPFQVRRPNSSKALSEMRTYLST